MARAKEQRAWDTMKRDLPPRFLAYRIENRINEAMPDVICMNERGTTFWLENKALDAWPARATTCPLANVFEPGQLPWLRQWTHRGGYAYVLLRVELDYFLMHPVGPLTAMLRKDIEECCLVRGKKKVIAFLENL